MQPLRVFSLSPWRRTDDSTAEVHRTVTRSRQRHLIRVRLLAASQKAADSLKNAILRYQSQGKAADSLGKAILRYESQGEAADSLKNAILRYQSQGRAANSLKGAILRYQSQGKAADSLKNAILRYQSQVSNQHKRHFIQAAISGLAGRLAGEEGEPEGID
jgi:hypothetical protein